MDRFEEFAEALYEALVHLRDPDHHLPALLYAATGCNPDAGPGPVQAQIVRGIEGLRPAPDLPQSSRAWREYQILTYRFVLGLTVEEAADQLYLARRTLQRAQREALHTLAGRIWRAWQERGHAGGKIDRVEAPAVTAGVHDQTADWRTQAQQELASLQSGAPSAATRVEPVIRDVLEMGMVLTERMEVQLELGFVQPEMATSIHPSVLRQMLVTAVRRLAAHATSGPLTIYGGLEDGLARVTLTALFDVGDPPSETELVSDILLPEGAVATAALISDTIFLSLRLPTPAAWDVLVVDDNPDIVHFYRRCVAGTGYRITHVGDANTLLEQARSSDPRAVVLDIMLPDVDGWKLLMRLRDDPATRAIPVIVCTVVREEQLALSLGAAAYLAKPVDAPQFVATLDRVTLTG